MRSIFRPVATAVCLLFAATLAYGQGGVTTSLSGSVVDSSGGIVPGADITAKNNATSAISSAVSNENGSFTIPALNPGTYTVTVSLMGFKTAVLGGRRAERRDAGVGARDARGGHARRDGRRAGRQRNHPDAVTRCVRDDGRQPDHQSSALEPQRARLRHLPAGRADAGWQPRFADQWSAEECHCHHLGRRQRSGQPPQVDRRLLRDHQPAAGRD